MSGSLLTANIIEMCPRKSHSREAYVSQQIPAQYPPPKIAKCFLLMTYCILKVKNVWRRKKEIWRNVKECVCGQAAGGCVRGEGNPIGNRGKRLTRGLEQERKPQKIVIDSQSGLFCADTLPVFPFSFFALSFATQRVRLGA